jgi:hypothetical protein
MSPRIVRSVRERRDERDASGLRQEPGADATKLSGVDVGRNGPLVEDIVPGDDLALDLRSRERADHRTATHDMQRHVFRYPG